MTRFVLIVLLCSLLNLSSQAIPDIIGHHSSLRDLSHDQHQVAHSWQDFRAAHANASSPLYCYVTLEAYGLGSNFELTDRYVIDGDTFVSSAHHLKECSVQGDRCTVKDSKGPDRVSDDFPTDDPLVPGGSTSNTTDNRSEKTMDQWYEWCLSVALNNTAHQEHEFLIFLSFFHDTGFLRICGYQHLECVDECFYGVSIETIALSLDNPDDDAARRCPLPKLTSSSNDESNRDRMALLIGVSVGTLLVFIIIIAFLVYIIRTCRRKREQQQRSEDIDYLKALTSVPDYQKIPLFDEDSLDSLSDEDRSQRALVFDSDSN
mmetsp:Transcript_9680/g.14582  ORF Transcript_9680/g.14582 Transcript_9680/m.14582 type:complete len:319 (+) Transcript_9680:36-992(+)